MTTSTANLARRRVQLEHKIEKLNTVLSWIALISLVGIILLGSFLLPYFVIRYGWVTR
jgi:hypothetical protein